MISLVLAAAAALPTPQTRSFWKLEDAPRPQPVQTRVTAELVREGERLVVYREKGYRFSTLGEDDEEAQVAAAVTAFDREIFPRLAGHFGPCPDRDGNGKVILLLTRSTRDEVTFLGFDLMPDSQAITFGLHSNEGEVLYLSFSRQGNLAAGNLAALAAAFHRLLHWSHDSREVAWAELLANYSTVLCGLESARGLWGDAGHQLTSPAPADAWTTHGWPLLLLEYVRERCGDKVLRELVVRPEPGLPGLAAALAAQEPPLQLDDVAADFAMACWLDDAAIASGRFAFPGLTPPRPPLVARASASRPTSSQFSCGAGGIVHLMIEGDGEHPLPLALRGDPRVRWLGRAVHLRQRGPDEELPLRFDDSGLARLELPLLPTGDGVIIAAMALPSATADLDRRRLTLLWGLGWVPRAWNGTDTDLLAAFSGRSPGLPAAAVARAAASLDRLGGLAAPAGGGAPITTRYAWSPDAVRTLELLEQEVRDRGLVPRSHVFLRSAPPDLHQDWTNVLVELPGTDERRWPVVIAAHWDAARGSLAESYHRALGLDENAAGVVTVLEAAQAAGGRQRRSPIVVALLAGGHHGAAGAAALLDHLQGRASAWIEVDGVGRPPRAPRQLEVRIEGAGERDALASAVAGALRQAGLVPVLARETSSPHTGAALAQGRGIPAVVIRTREVEPGAPDRDVPAVVEREQVSPELAAMLGQALSRALTALAGTPTPGA
jgi:hypothetical protein